MNLSSIPKILGVLGAVTFGVASLPAKAEDVTFTGTVPSSCSITNLPATAELTFVSGRLQTNFDFNLTSNSSATLSMPPTVVNTAVSSSNAVGNVQLSTGGVGTLQTAQQSSNSTTTQSILFSDPLDNRVIRLIASIGNSSNTLPAGDYSITQTITCTTQS